MAMLRLRLLGVGAMNSPRYRPAGLLVAWSGTRLMLDGGGDAVPTRRVDGWLVTDPRAELIADIRRHARTLGVTAAVGGWDAAGPRARLLPVSHTAHPTYGRAGPDRTRPLPGGHCAARCHPVGRVSVPLRVALRPVGLTSCGAGRPCRCPTAWAVAAGAAGAAATILGGVGYRVLADATMVMHFAFLAYVVGGGFLAWRWAAAIWPHLLLAGWGLSTIVLHLNCPLTYVENWARRRSGQPVLTQGFIDHYLTGVVYPRRYAGLMQLLAAAVVAVSWVGVLVRWRRRRRGGGLPAAQAGHAHPSR